MSNPTSTREISYKNYKNKLSSTLRAAKRNYFEKKFEECNLVHSYLEMASLTLSLTDILIRGRQTNSQVSVSGVPSRRENLIAG